MNIEHKKIIDKRKKLAAFNKACKIYNKYTLRMNDVNVVKKMIVDHKITEKYIMKAIIAHYPNSKDHAQYCIREAYKTIYKGNKEPYSPFIKLACGEIIFWKSLDFIKKIEIGKLVHCKKCGKIEGIIEIIDTEAMQKFLKELLEGEEK